MTPKMRFRRPAVCMLGFFLLLACVSTGCAESVCDHVDMSWLQTQVSVPKDAKLVYKKEQGALCEAVISFDGGLAPLYAGKDFIVAGQLYKKGVSITRKPWQACLTLLMQNAKRPRRKRKRLLRCVKLFQNPCLRPGRFGLFELCTGRGVRQVYLCYFRPGLQPLQGFARQSGRSCC